MWLNAKEKEFLIITQNLVKRKSSTTQIIPSQVTVDNEEVLEIIGIGPDDPIIDEYSKIISSLKKKGFIEIDDEDLGDPLFDIVLTIKGTLYTPLKLREMVVMISSVLAAVTGLIVVFGMVLI